MNTNFLRKDGFSNPETKRLFEEHWNDDVTDEQCKRMCGLCNHGFFLDPPDLDWVLCLNRDGPHAFETVSCMFTCPAHEPTEDVPASIIIEPRWFPRETWN